MQHIKVLLGDNKEIFREGLARLLEEQGHIEVVSQCFNGKQAVEKVRETEPDVVLLDSSISDCNSNEATREIKDSSSQIKVAMLTDSENEQELFSAIESGATGYLLKDMKVVDLIQSIDLVSKGEVVISPPLAEKLVSKFTSLRADEAKNQTELSEREIEIVALLARGATNKDIAERLFITENTTKAHLKNIREKLQLRKRQQVVAHAIQQGLVTEIMNIEEKST
jgi:DNA-binding NarL/FixJ family response regulator